MVVENKGSFAKRELEAYICSHEGSGNPRWVLEVGVVASLFRGPEPADIKKHDQYRVSRHEPLNHIAT